MYFSAVSTMSRFPVWDCAGKQFKWSKKKKKVKNISRGTKYVQYPLFIGIRLSKQRYLIPTEVTEKIFQHRHYSRMIVLSNADLGNLPIRATSASTVGLICVCKSGCATATLHSVLRQPMEMSRSVSTALEHFGSTCTSSFFPGFAVTMPPNDFTCTSAAAFSRINHRIFVRVCP